MMKTIGSLTLMVICGIALLCMTYVSGSAQGEAGRIGGLVSSSALKTVTISPIPASMMPQLATLVFPETTLLPPFPGVTLSRQSNLPMCDDQRLQSQLSQLGYLTDSEEWSNGVFGLHTEAAVKAFQSKNGLRADGVVSLKVWEVLFSAGVRDANDNTFLSKVTSTPTAPPPMLYRVGAQPGLLAFDGRRVWALNRKDDTIISIDPSSGQVGAPIRLGGCPLDGNHLQPQNMIYSKKMLWVNFLDPSGSLQGIDPQTGVAKQPIDFNGEPPVFSASALGLAGARLWASSGDDQIVAVEPFSGKIITQRTAGFLAYGRIVFDGACLWVNLGDGQVAAPVDSGDGKCRAKGVWLPAGSLAFDGVRVWSAGDREAVSYDTRSGQVSEPLGLKGTVADMVFDGALLWVVYRDANELQAILPQSGQVSAPVNVGNQPSALLWDGHRLWVSNEGDGTVQVVAVDAVVLPTLLPATATPMPTPTATSPAFQRELRLEFLNLTGDDVLSVQARLKLLGYCEVGALDGVFGPKTDWAVRHFQARNQLVVDGVIGPITWKALFSQKAVRGGD